MAFLIGLLSFIVAGDVVDLEPVGVSATNNWGCNIWSATANQTACTNSPYCRWYGSGSNYKCYDDPCLKLMTAGQTCTSVTLDGGGVTETVTCTEITSLGSKFQNGDCSDTATPLSICAQTVPTKNTNAYTYCMYAKLRDGTCPDSVCREYDPQATDNSLKGQCIKNDKTGCEILSTEEECGMVPKCYWKSSKCNPDPCYIVESAIPGGGVCSGYHPVAGATCKEFKPYTKNGGGSVATYCVISDNKNPNLCYLGQPGTDPAHATDYLKTYPTTRFSTPNGNLASTPTCDATGITSCNNMGNCSLVINKKGGLAGAYCSDGTHGAANILRVPSLFVILLIALAALFNF